MTKLFKLFKKPTAVVRMTRLTSQEESCEIIVNVFEPATEEVLAKAVQDSGEALRKRVAFNNSKLMNIKDPIPSMSVGRA